MKFLLFGILILVLASENATAQLPHWGQLPFQVNRNTVRTYHDTSTNELYLFGSFNQVDSVNANIIIWDGGNTYRTLPVVPRAGIIATVIRFKDKLYCSADAGLFRLNDTTWELLDENPMISCFYIRQDKLICAGVFDQICGRRIANAAVYDGDTTWTDLYRLDTLLNGFKEYWTITQIAEYKGDLYISGNMNPIGKDPAISEIARFDGKNWKDVGGGIQTGSFGGVSRMLVWNDKLYVSGFFDEGQGAPGNCIAAWDGQRWSRLGYAAWKYFESIRDMAVYRNDLYVVGPFSNIDGLKAENFARWDGRSWCVFGSGPEGSPSQITNYKDRLFLTGFWMTVSGDSSYRHCAEWLGGDYVSECSEPTSITVAPPPSSPLEISPVPALDFVEVTVPALAAGRPLAISVRNMLGQVVNRSDHAAAGASRIRIDLSGLPAGHYIAELQAGKDRWWGKLIKQ